MEEWLGELAFVNYWRVIEEFSRGSRKAPEWQELPLDERYAWVEATKAIQEAVRQHVLR